MITVKDVAERAGVEVKTARRALAGLTMGKRRDARERAERVLKAAEELGYSPSQAALSLRNGRTGNIGFVVGSITNPFFSAAAEVAMDEAERFGYSLAIRLTRWDAARRLECVKRDQSSGADGVLLAGELGDDADPFYRELRRRNYPLLTFCCPNVLGFSSLTGEGGTALAEAVRFLAGAGHRRILFGAYGQGGSSQGYAAAFAVACRELGVEAETVFNQSVGEAAELAQRRDLPPAVILFGKYSLQAFLEERRRFRHPLPALVGFYDEWTWAGAPQQELAGVIFSSPENALRAAVRQLIGEIDRREEPRQLVFPMTFVPRAGFGALPAKDFYNHVFFW